MLRTTLLFALPAALIVTSWLGVEEPAGPHAIAIAALALLPALAAARWARTAAAVLAAALAVELAFGRWFLEARPRRDADFFGPLARDFEEGFLGFWDVGLPFSSVDEPLMHGVVLMAVFGFCLWLSLALAARRPLMAAAALVVGAAWPATLVTSGNELLRGAAIFAALLLILVGSARRSPRAHRQALLAGTALVLAAAAASTSPAVAKGAFLGWESWDAYDAPDDPVSVAYVWDANYDGIEYPEKKTTVLKVRGPSRPLYWRATTLDLFSGHRWVQERRFVADERRGTIALAGDPLLPRAARDPERWVSVDVTVEALRGRHVIGPATPVEYRTGNLPPVRVADSGVGILYDGLRRGHRYGVSSYAPEPKPAQLVRARARYPLELVKPGAFLDVGRNVTVPVFGAPARERRMQTLFREDAATDGAVAAYEDVWAKALEVVGSPRSPYTAAVALERWFRSSGGFAYDEQPRLAPGVPPLAAFVLTTKRGYCQHYAGAMALMLRYLGIPARVAAGFTSGRYDRDTKTWTVTDHEAHTWVEAWFDGYGWLPFDPTPGRGRLSASYTASSANFDALRAAELARAYGASSTAFSSEIQRLRLGEQLRVENRGGGTSRAPQIAEKGGSLLALLALAGGVVVVLIALVKLVVRRGRYLTRDPHRVVRACRAELGDYLRDQKVDVSDSATLVELGRVLERRIGVGAGRFVAAASEARYGPPVRAAASARRARREAASIRKELRRTLSRTERLRGLLSVRSLGFSG